MLNKWCPERETKGFTLIELLVVITIIALLAAILFPVFARAKAAAKQTQCLSNLKQIGTAITLYMNDYDSQFPAAVDPSDKYQPSIWSAQPAFAARIPSMPMMHQVLQPYLNSAEIFHCPSDVGTEVLDNSFPIPFHSAPSLFKAYGTSYFFRTEIAFKYFSQEQFKLPANVNVMFDAAGHWHGAGRGLQVTDNISTISNLISGYRYNCLFGDMHAKSLTYGAMELAWATGL
jgi:general secretion pathway protein G